MPHILAQLNTCDLENYGDLLYPVVLARMLEQRGWQHDIRNLAFLPGVAPGNGGYRVESLTQVLRSATERWRSLVIGGGDVVRTDTRTLASHYRGIYAQRQPLWARLLGKLRPGRDLADEFQRRFMNYDAVGPFLLDPRRHSTFRQVAYCSCGVPFVFQDQETPRVREALRAASFIYLRDEQSRQKLLDIGVDREIHVAPDLIVTLSDFFDQARERARGRELLRSWSVDVAKEALCFQATALCPTSQREIVRQLLQYQEQTGCEVMLLPIGYCHDDHRFLQKLQRLSGGRFRYVGVHSIFDMLSVIAAAEIFVGTSLHGNITAFSYGIPHLLGPLAVDKIAGFLNVAGLPNELRLESWAGLGAALEHLRRLGREPFRQLADVAKRRVHRVVDELFAILNRPGLPALTATRTTAATGA